MISVGDSLQTNNGLFQWRVTSITTPSPNTTSLIYKSASLDNCDSSDLAVNWDLHTQTLNAELQITCGDHDVLRSLDEDQGIKVYGEIPTFVASASLKTAFIPAIKNPVLVGSGEQNYQFSFPYLMQLAVFDIFSIENQTFFESNGTTESMVFVRARGIFSPPHVLHNNRADEREQVPKLDLLGLNEVTSTRYGLPLDIDQVESRTYYRPLFNLLRLLHFAVRLDLGNLEQHNFLAKPWLGNKTLVSLFPPPDILVPGSSLYSTVAFSANVSVNVAWNATTTMVYPPKLAFSLTNDTVFENNYVCRVQQMRPAGFVFVSVAAGTFTMFATAWTIFMFIATYFEKRARTEANFCQGHVEWQNLVLPLGPPSSENLQGDKIAAVGRIDPSMANLVVTPLDWPVNASPDDLEGTPDRDTLDRDVPDRDGLDRERETMSLYSRDEPQ